MSLPNSHCLLIQIYIIRSEYEALELLYSDLKYFKILTVVLTSILIIYITQYA